MHTISIKSNTALPQWFTVLRVFNIYFTKMENFIKTL